MKEFLSPDQIEKRSFEIITELLGDKKIAPENEAVVKRVIHTTADFDFADTLVFSEDAVQKGVRAIQNGCDIITDTGMALAGINKKILARYGGSVQCFMADPDVAAEADARGITRAAVSMERAAACDKVAIIAIGNAPTALIRLRELIDAGAFRVLPALVIGVPVGFVHVEESKEMFPGCGVPYIIAKGRKGGSAVAAAVCNALLYQLGR